MVILSLGLSASIPERVLAAHSAKASKGGRGNPKPRPRSMGES